MNSEALQLLKQHAINSPVTYVHLAVDTSSTTLMSCIDAKLRTFMCVLRRCFTAMFHCCCNRLSNDVLRMRLLSRFVNEAVLIHQETILNNPVSMPCPTH